MAKDKNIVLKFSLVCHYRVVGYKYFFYCLFFVWFVLFIFLSFLCFIYLIYLIISLGVSP
ncbi:hypothetical protein GIB67_028053, partial [Kingdonia uniflora]